MPSRPVAGSSRRRLLRSLACVPVLGAPALAAAQAFPSRPIKLVVPAAPGGGTDVMARSLGKVMAEQHGVPVATIGTVGPVDGEFAVKTAGAAYRWPVPALRNTYFNAIPRRMSHVAEDRAAV